MGPPQNLIERALTLCRNGEVRSWSALRRRLDREGYDGAGPELLRHRDRLDDALARAARDRAPPVSARHPAPCSRPTHGVDASILETTDGR